MQGNYGKYEYLVMDESINLTVVQPQPVVSDLTDNIFERTN